MKFISWNVNGLRACVQKGFLDFFNEIDADFFCIQESKLQEGQIDLDLPGYQQYWNYAEKKGYSGTALFTKQKPLSVTYGIGIPEHDKEGRVITAEFADFYVVTVYTPNSQRELTRLSYRMEWEAAFLAYINGLNEKKPVIFCGDLNVAHKEIDLKNPRTNRHNAGFTDEERSCFDKVLECGYMLPRGLSPQQKLCAGEVGYFTASIKKVSDTRAGDTVTGVENPTPEALPGYRPARPMVL